MNGKVYMFNISGEEMSNIQIHANRDGSKIGGWSTSLGTKYTPQELPVERIKLHENKFAFAQGDNRVSFNRPTNHGEFMVAIDSGLLLNDDLIPYVTRNVAILMWTSGDVIETVPFSATLATADAS